MGPRRGSYLVIQLYVVAPRIAVVEASKNRHIHHVGQEAAEGGRGGVTLPGCNRGCRTGAVVQGGGVGPSTKTGDGDAVTHHTAVAAIREGGRVSRREGMAGPWGVGKGRVTCSVRVSHSSLCNVGLGDGAVRRFEGGTRSEAFRWTTIHPSPSCRGFLRRPEGCHAGGNKLASPRTADFRA